MTKDAAYAYKAWNHSAWNGSFDEWKPLNQRPVWQWLRNRGYTVNDGVCATLALLEGAFAPQTLAVLGNTEPQTISYTSMGWTGYLERDSAQGLICEVEGIPFAAYRDSKSEQIGSASRTSTQRGHCMD